MLTQETNTNKRIPIVFLLLTILFSIFLRLGVAYLWKDNFFQRGNRASLIHPTALNLIHHKEFSVVPGSPTAENEPLYSMFVAFSYILFGANWFSIALTQSLIGILNAVIIYFITLKIFKKRNISLAAFLLVLFYPYYALGSLSISDTAFFCFWLALSTYLTILCVQSPGKWIFVCAGLSWGLTLLTRFSAVFLFPFALLYIFINFPFKKAFQAAAVAFLACLITLVPWIYRNYKLTNKLFISSHGWIEIWFGYNKDTRGVIRNDISVDSMRKDLVKKIPQLKEIREKEYSASILKEAAENRIFFKEALNFALKNPWQSLSMMPLKFRKFWSWEYNPVPTSRDPVQDIFRRIIYTLSYLPVLLLALGGFVLTRSSWRSHSIFLLIFFGYSLLHTLVYGFSRLRIPLDQFLIIYAAYTIIFLFKKMKLFFASES